MSRAICVFREGGVTGTVFFEDDCLGGVTKITGSISGLAPGEHSFHVTQVSHLIISYANLLHSYPCDIIAHHYTYTAV
jgi:hypothetical protein